MAALAGGAAGGVLGALSAHRERVEDQGRIPGKVLSAAGDVGQVARANALGAALHGVYHGRTKHTSMVPFAVGGLVNASNLKPNPIDVRAAQVGHRLEVIKLNSKRARGELSEAEHAQRVAAAKKRWAGRARSGTAASDLEDLHHR